MRVILEKAYRRWSVGHIFTDMPDNQAGALIARGVARELADKDVAAAPADRMMRRSPVRKAPAAA